MTEFHHRVGKEQKRKGKGRLRGFVRPHEEGLDYSPKLDSHGADRKLLEFGMHIV